MSDTFWSRSRKLDIFAISEQTCHDTLQKWTRYLLHMILHGTTRHNTTYVFNNNYFEVQRLHSECPTTSLLSARPRQTPVQDQLQTVLLIGAVEAVR
jgi:hypothetical protein